LFLSTPGRPAYLPVPASLGKSGGGALFTPSTHAPPPFLSPVQAPPTPAQQAQWEVAQAVAEAAAETARVKFYQTSEEFEGVFKFIRAIPNHNEKVLREYLDYDPRLPVTRLVGVGNLACEGQTPLHLAASVGATAAIRLFLELGERPAVSVWVRDLQGRTPLHVAAEFGQLETCRLLRELMKTEGLPDPVGQHAPVDLGGTTPLGWATKNGQLSSRKAEMEAALFGKGDASILPLTPCDRRVGKSPWKLPASLFSDDKHKKSGRKPRAASSASAEHTPLPAAPAASQGLLYRENLLFAFSEAQGWTPKMEDRVAVCCPVPGRPVWNFFGVFDGHGGAFSASFLAANFPQAVAEVAAEFAEQNQSALLPGGTANDLDTTPALLEAVLAESCRRLDEKLRGLKRMKMLRRDGQLHLKDSSGSTAVVALVTLAYVAVANVGDSRAVLARRRPTATTAGVISDPFALSPAPAAPLLEAFPLSRDHKASLPEERERVLQAGAE
jgi:serine/threonine protein phosphatase PrpC